MEDLQKTKTTKGDRLNGSGQTVEREQIIVVIGEDRPKGRYRSTRNTLGLNPYSTGIKRPIRGSSMKRGKL